jgi:hypothetical protein
MLSGEAVYKQAKLALGLWLWRRGREGGDYDNLVLPLHSQWPVRHSPEPEWLLSCLQSRSHEASPVKGQSHLLYHTALTRETDPPRCMAGDLAPTPAHPGRCARAPSMNWAPWSLSAGTIQGWVCILNLLSQSLCPWFSPVPGAPLLGWSPLREAMSPPKRAWWVLAVPKQETAIMRRQGG